MGCGSSQPAGSPSSPVPDQHSSNNNRVKHNGDLPNGDAKINGHIPTPRYKSQEPRKNNVDALTTKDGGGDNQSAAKGVAFEVTLNNNIDSIISKHPPKRLKRLEPLPEMHRLTAEELLEKQKIAEEKREKELEKRREKSRKHSRLRQQLNQAKDFEMAQRQYTQIEIKQSSATKRREAKVKEQEERLRIRAERAKRAREKAKKLEEGGIDEVDFEVEKDDNFNAEEDDDVDSWLDGDNNTTITNLTSAASSRKWSGTERVYSGRESPSKSFDPDRPKLPRATASASTTDSFDYAFQRTPASGNSKGDSNKDNFWD